MLKNFSFEGSVGVRFENKHYDLHSFFSVERIVILPSNSSLLIKFVAIDQFVSLTHGVKWLSLIFMGIDYLEFSPQFCKIRTDTLEEFGFKAPNDKDDNWLKSTDHSLPSDHLFVRFSNLEFMRILCRSLRIEVTDSQCLS